MCELGKWHVPALKSEFFCFGFFFVTWLCKACRFFYIVLTETSNDTKYSMCINFLILRENQMCAIPMLHGLQSCVLTLVNSSLFIPGCLSAVYNQSSLALLTYIQYSTAHAREVYKCVWGHLIRVYIYKNTSWAGHTIWQRPGEQSQN